MVKVVQFERANPKDQMSTDCRLNRTPYHDTHLEWYLQCQPSSTDTYNRLLAGTKVAARSLGSIFSVKLGSFANGLS